MIEFKADCGHTVRAKSDDAGQVVRCSYCGRNAKVPEEGERDLDALFAEIQQESSDSIVATAAAPRRRRRRRNWFGARSPSSRGEFNPFPMILKLVYAAALIVVLILVYQKAVKPLLSDEGRTTRSAKKKEDAAEKRRGNNEQPARRRGAGLVSDSSSGLLVHSTPLGATVFCVESAKAPPKGRIDRVKGCQQFKIDETGSLNIPEGVYVVEVVFAYNDPKLKAYPGYTEFRRAIDGATDAQRRELIEAYFIPDEATDVFVSDVDESKYLVRQYREIDIQQGRPKAVRALFLPRIKVENGPRFAIEPLVVGPLGGEPKSYTFDENHVGSELAYYNVPDADRRWIMDALSRIGTISYMTPDLRTRLFRIGAFDGVFSAPIVREPK